MKHLDSFLWCFISISYLLPLFWNAPQGATVFAITNLYPGWHSSFCPKNNVFYKPVYDVWIGYRVFAGLPLLVFPYGEIQRVMSDLSPSLTLTAYSLTLVI